MGNGFSIDLPDSKFSYLSLYESIQSQASCEIRQIFEYLGTHDFETVINALDVAAAVTNILSVRLGNAKEFRQVVEEVKLLLIEALEQHHPKRPGNIKQEELWNCRKFLSHFLCESNKGCVFSVNYDLLLYWIVMQENKNSGGIDLRKGDGFGRVTDRNGKEVLAWKGGSYSKPTDFWFLHGALHLFQDGRFVCKKSSKETNKTLIEQVRDALTEGDFPLFVAEGDSDKKLEKIRNSRYLRRGLEKLRKNAKQKNSSFFVFGHSISESDDHILQCLREGRFRDLYVSIFEGDKIVQSRAEKLVEERGDQHPLRVNFFDSASASVWKTAI